MAWFNVNWPYRNKFTINNTGQGQLSDFPVTINVLPGSGRYIRWDMINAAGNDIRFTDADGTTVLNHDIERLDPTLNTLVAHVKIPILASGASAQEFYMYYGNPKVSAPSAASKQATWDANYVLVHHMDERSGIYQDSTANATHAIATSGSVTYTNRYVGFRMTNGANGLMDMYRPTALNDIGTITVECVGIQSNAIGFQTLIDKKMWYFNLNAGKPEFYRDFDGAADGKWITDAAVWGTTNIPHHLAVTYNKGATTNDPIIYIDGAPVAITESTTPVGTAVSDATKHLRYGKQSDPARNSLTGSIDELRISNTIRSADWIKATNKSLTGRMVSKANSLEQATPSGNVTGWWNSNWGYRKRLTSDTYGYTYVSGQHFMRVRADIAALLSAGKTNIGYDDIRIVRQIPSGYYECPTYIASGVSPAWIYFPCAKSLPSGINLGNEATVHYYMYYGNPTPGVMTPKTWYNYNCPQAPWSPRPYNARTASGWYDKMFFRFNELSGPYARDYGGILNQNYTASGTTGILWGQRGRLETSIYIPGDTAGQHLLVKNKHNVNPSGNWMLEFWYKPRQLNATSNYLIGLWGTAASAFLVDIGGKAVKGRTTVAEAAANVLALAAQTLIASSGKWYFTRITGKFPYGAAANVRRMWHAVSGTWGKKTHYVDLNETGNRAAAASTAKNFFIGALYNATNTWQGGFDGWVESFRYSTWPGELFPSGVNKQYTKPWMVSSEYTMSLGTEETQGAPPGPTYNSVPWARLGGYTSCNPAGSGTAHIGGLIDADGHPVPVGRVGGYILTKVLAGAYGAGLLGGFVEGLVHNPDYNAYVGGYISSVTMTSVPVALLGAISSGLQKREGYLGAFLYGRPNKNSFCETRDRTLIKANSEQAIDQAQNIDAIITLKGLSSSDFNAQFTWSNTRMAQFHAKVAATKYRTPPTIRITSITPNNTTLVSGVRQVTVAATGSLGDGLRWTHAYIDFGDPFDRVNPMHYTPNMSISGWSSTGPVWTATHDYHASGQYIITARAQDEYGMIGMDASGLNLNTGLVKGVDYPALSISGTPRQGNVPTALAVAFSASTSGINTLGTISNKNILWNFGNRETSKLLSPTSYYHSPGLYAPTLRYRYVNASGTPIWVQDTLLLGYNR